MTEKKLSRREFLIAATAATGGAILAACAAPPATEQPAAATATPQPAEATPVPAEPTMTPKPTVEVFAEVKPPPVPPAFDGQPQWTPQNMSGQKLLLWGLNYDPHKERYEILAKTFKERTGVETEIQPQEWPIDEKIMAAMAAGSPPDTVCWMGKMLAPLVRQKAVLPIDDTVFAPLGISMDKWWRPGAIGAYLYEGKHYGVPVEDNGDGFNVSGRLDLLEKASAEAKAIWADATKNTWFESYDAMFKLGEALQQKNDDGSVKVWGLNSSGWEQHSLLSIQRSLGVFWWDNEKKQFNLDNDEMAQAFDLLCAKPLEMGIEGILGMEQINAFVAGTVALARGNFSSAGEGWKVGIQGENVIAPPPVKGQPPLFVGEGGWGFEIPKGAKNEAAAVEFLKFTCTYEAQYIFSQIYGGGMPANNSVAQSDIYGGDHPVKVGLRRCVKALENCVYWGNDMAVGGQAGTPFEEISASVREKKLTPKEAAKQLQDACTKLYQQWLSEA